jgi:acetyl-CoA carboxylase carboxyltransferase component
MMSGWAPTVAVVSGRAFAGNATIAGHSDLVIATRGSAVGMGGPPLVEQALGIKVTPEELGAVEMHEKSGGIDLLVADEPAAIAAAKRYLRFFLHEEDSAEPSPTADSIASIVPENRRRAYDMRKVVHALVDSESLFELRPNWAKTVITTLARMGGKTVGLLANQPMSNRVGAIDADACDKITRFVQLCDAFDFPLVSLIDNPGFMIGPDAERAGIARRHARTIMAHVHRTVPLYCVQIRKGYGLGPAAMGGMYGRCDLSLAWPTCETGGMGLEGAASLAQRDQIAAAGDDQAAIRAIREEYAAEVRRGKSGLSAGRNNSFDDIVDPAETRDRIIAILRFNQRAVRTQKKHYIDTW